MTHRKAFPTALLAAFCLLFTACENPDGVRSSTARERASPLGDRTISSAELFLPGVISTGDYELNAAVAPDGETIYFTKSTPDSRFALMTLASTRFENGEWQQPEVMPFSGMYTEVDPFPSPDGNRIWYISKRPVTGTEAREDFDVWYVDRDGPGWGDPQHLEGPVNTDGNEYFPAVSTDGTLYYSARRDDSRGGYDLYRSMRTDSGYSEPENLGDAVNSEGSEIDVYVDPEERYIIFVSYRDGGQGRGDLYISYNRDGVWTKAENLGDAVNTPAREYCPFVSPDGRYLLFTSERAFTDTPLERPLTYEDLIGRIRGPGNGMGDVYRISLEALPVDLPAE